MNEQERWIDVYYDTPVCERNHYVYVWFERVGDEWIPFYVGKGRGRRAYNTGNRSKTLTEYIASREIQKIIVAPALPASMAYYMEHRIKEELKNRGFRILDAEDDKIERKRRQAEGIERAKASGVHFGRESKDVDLTLRPGENVTEACERIGISRNTYYRKLREAQA